MRRAGPPLAGVSAADLAWCHCPCNPGRIHWGTTRSGFPLFPEDAVPNQATTITVIDACGRAGVPTLLMSDPGKGKTSMVRALAASRDLPCMTVLGSIREPADFSGLPVPRDGGVVLWPPSWAQDLHEAGKGVLLLDELTTCPPGVQAAMLGVALERRVGDLVLPRDVIVIACANPPDKAADGWALAPSLANRFCHMQFRPDPEEYTDGLTSGWATPSATRAIDASFERIAASRAAVAAFLRTNQHLMDAYPATAAEASGPWPSRRTWTMTADVLARLRGDDTDARQALVYGLVGEGAGTEFLQWLQAADLPDPVQVLANPSGVNWKDRPDKVYGILASVIAHCTAGSGSAQRWRDAWGPLVAAAAGGAPDVAAAAARVLGMSRPNGVLPPTAAHAFGTFLREAGLGGMAGKTGQDREMEL